MEKGGKEGEVQYRMTYKMPDDFPRSVLICCMAHSVSHWQRR